MNNMCKTYRNNYVKLVFLTTRFPDIKLLCAPSCAPANDRNPLWHKAFVFIRLNKNAKNLGRFLPRAVIFCFIKIKQKSFILFFCFVCDTILTERNDRMSPQIYAKRISAIKLAGRKNNEIS